MLKKTDVLEYPEDQVLRILRIIKIIIQHIDTLPKYGKKTLDVRRST